MASPQPTWIEHRRDSDRERLGWVHQHGAGWVAVDLLGRELAETTDLARAEQALDELGLGYLAEKWEFAHDDGRVEPVRLVEVTPETILFKTEDYGAMDAPVVVRAIPWPAPAALRPRR